MSMSAVEEILGQLNIDQLAAQLGVDPGTAEQAAAAVIPSLIGGLAHNADNGHENAIAGALVQHGGSSLLGSGPVDLGSVDTADGEKIVQHIFGDQSGQMAAALGQRTGASKSLIQQLLPILAPIVLAYLAKKLTGGSSQQSGGGSILNDILGSVLGSGGLGGGAPSQQSAGGGVLGSILGTILAGGGLDSILGGGQASAPQGQQPDVQVDQQQDQPVDLPPDTTPGSAGSLQVDESGDPQVDQADSSAQPTTGGSIVDDILGSIFGKR